MSTTTRVSAVSGRLLPMRWPRRTQNLQTCQTLPVSAVSPCLEASRLQIRLRMRRPTGGGPRYGVAMSIEPQQGATAPGPQEGMTPHGSDSTGGFTSLMVTVLVGPTLRAAVTLVGSTRNSFHPTYVPHGEGTGRERPSSWT